MKLTRSELYNLNLRSVEDRKIEGVWKGRGDELEPGVTMTVRKFVRRYKVI